MSESQKSQNQTSRPKKTKGPIRWEAVGPFLILLTVFWAYFHFFFDTHVRHGLEYLASRINGAEVNIGSINSSFWNASLEIKKVQMTDALAPEKNKIELGRIHWKMLWDAALRGKVVIDDASISDIALGTPRSRPGFVIPPPPPPTQSESKTSELTKEVLERSKAEFNQNIFADIASMLSGPSGEDPLAELEKSGVELKSKSKISSLQNELNSKQREWAERLAELPQSRDLQSFQDRFKAIKLDRFSGPLEVQQSLQQLDSLFKDVNSKFQEIRKTHQDLNADLARYQAELQTIPTLINDDISSLESRLKIPKLDSTTLAKILLGPQVLAKILQAQHYLGIAREYMPPKKNAAEKAQFAPPTPHERIAGRNYQFGQPKSYPLFWLKRAAISSKATGGAELSGNLSGELLNFSSDQNLAGQPATAVLNGDFPQQGIFGFESKLTLDHRTENPLEIAEIKVDQYRIKEQVIFDTNNATITIPMASGSTQFSAKFQNATLNISSNTTVSHESDQAAPLLEATSPQLVIAEILKGSLKDVKSLRFSADISGSWSDPKFSMHTNLADELNQGFSKHLQLKIKELNDRLRSFVSSSISAEQSKLLAQLTQQRTSIDERFKQAEAELNQTKTNLDRSKEKALKQQFKGIEQEGQKAVEDLKKKFGF